MFAPRARSTVSDRVAPGPRVLRLAGSAPDRSGGACTEVVTTEPAIKRALVPLMGHPLADGVVVTCEIMPGVGRYVLGNRRELTDLVARAAAEGIAACGVGEVCVRIARQRSGFAPTSTVLVSVSVLRGREVEDIASFETSLPLAEGEEVDDRTMLAGKSILLVVPTAHSARVLTTAARRFGGTVEPMVNCALAELRLRAANLQRRPFDVLYVDESTVGAEELLCAARDDLSLGAPRRLVATALDDASIWIVQGAESTLAKPALPFELCEAVRDARHADESAAEVSEETMACIPPSRGRRRVSGTRNLDLAAVLAAVAVAPARERR
jgi:hypothetical protein